MQATAILFTAESTGRGIECLTQGLTASRECQSVLITFVDKKINWQIGSHNVAAHQLLSQRVSNVDGFAPGTLGSKT